MLRVFSIEQADEWDKIVHSFKMFDVYYLSGYVKAFQIHGDGTPFLFYYQDENCRGINVVMKRDIAFDPRFKQYLEPGKYFDFSVPYGYGGWLIEGNNSKRLFKEYEKWCFDNYIVSEFVRFHPILENYKISRSYYDVTYLGETVAIDLDSKESIWNNFTKKNRNVIRKAIKNNVEIKEGLSEELLDSFKYIYNETMKKDNADEYYFFKDNFYKSIKCCLEENAKIFYATKDSKIIAASIIIFANKSLNYHLSGSLIEYRNFAPTNLLLWKAAEWGFLNGYRTFHLGGGVGCKEDSLLKFKKGFYRGECRQFYIGKKIFNLKLYNYLLSLRKNDKQEDFFPEYRG